MSNEKYILAETDYMSGMKYKDIADKYNVTINTVKSWKKRYGWERKKGAHKIEKGCTQKRKVQRVVEEAVEQVIENPDLTDKQRLFCVIYIRCFNATKAYQKAYGCSYATAVTNGPALLGNTRIRDEIKRLKQNRLNQEMLDESDIFQRYMDIAFADITDYVTFGQEEVPVMAAFGPVQVTDPDTGEKVTLTKRVNTVRFRESSEVDGALISEVKQGKDGASIKLLDQMKAMQWVSDHMGMATEEQREKIKLMQARKEKLTGENENEEALDKLDSILKEMRDNAIKQEAE